MQADGVDFKEAQAPKTDGMTDTDTDTGDYQGILHVLWGTWRDESRRGRLCRGTWRDARRRGRRPKIVGAGSFAHFKEAQAPKTVGMTGTDTNTGDYQDILHVL